MNIYTSVNNIKKEIFKDFLIPTTPKKSSFDKPNHINKIYKRNIREGFFTANKKYVRFQ